MIKRILTVLALFVICGVLGGGYAFYSLKKQSKGKVLALQNGCWTVNESMALEDTKQRALVAIAGLFALRESEVLYFVARVDSDGEPLRSDQDYIMECPAPDARYWSYTMYGHDYFLIDNPKNIYGYNMDDIQYIDESDNPEMPSNILGNHQVTLSSSEKGDNWLPTGNEDQFYITLRMYNPSPAVYNNLETITLPTIKKINK